MFDFVITIRLNIKPNQIKFLIIVKKRRMFFGDQLLGGRRSRQKGQKRKPISLKPKAFKLKPEKEKNLIFGDFASEIQVKSLDTIVKDYKSNAFFKIKIDLLLKEVENEENQKPSFLNVHKANMDTLRGSLSRDKQIYKLRLLQVKKKIDQIKKEG